MQQSSGFFPPALFAAVDTGLYRSSAPEESAIPFLLRFSFKHVIYLSPDMISKVVVRALENHGSVIHNIGLATWERGVVDTRSLVKESLELVLHKENLPALLCCSCGVGQCAVVVGCLRRMQLWSLASIFAEYRFFAGNLAQVEHEQLIEIFDPSSVHTRTEHLPPWQVAVNDTIAREARLLERLPSTSSSDDAQPTKHAEALAALIAELSPGGLVAASTSGAHRSLVPDDDDSD